ncbi:MAG: DUF3667 domain-containing protein [Saprospiraceae bacterium]|nr:DUF3667 domain-containing protein [Saprospiraceae bacterium]
MEKICIQCGALLNGPFCSACGANQQKSQIKFGNFFNVLFEFVTNWERKLSSTIKDLFNDPGTVVRHFTDISKEKYYHPVKFLLFWGGINFLATKWMHVGFFQKEPDPDLIMQRAVEFVKEYWSFVWMATMPFTALGHYILSFRKDGKFVHHCVFASYLVGMNLLINIPLFLIDKFYPDLKDLNSTIHLICSFAIIFHFTRMWLLKNIWWSLFVSVFIYLSTYIGVFIYLVIIYVLFHFI